MIVDSIGRLGTLQALKSLYLLDFRHKKRRPWTSLDVEMVEPGPFELVGDVLVIIGLGAPLEIKAYTGAYMLLVAAPCQAIKLSCDEC